MSDKEVAKIMRLGLSFVRSKAEELGLEKEEDDTAPFSNEEINYVSAVYKATSPIDIAKSLGRDSREIEYLAQTLGLRKPKEYYELVASQDPSKGTIKQWEKEYSKKEMGCSKGHYLVGKILKTIYPHLEHKDEVPIGKLRLDWYTPQLGIAFEFNGTQHENHIEFFHKTEQDFKDAINRDHDKIGMCKSLGVVIIRIFHDEPITIDVIKKKISEVS